MQSFILVAALTTIIPQDGSLLFVENGDRVVQWHTDSTVTHVAIILKENDDFWVYEAVPPEVRKIKLTEYLSEIQKMNRIKIWIANPNEQLTQIQHNQMKKYLDKQIGRKYSIKSYIRGSPGKCIHCCELTGFAFRIAGLTYSENPCSDCPWDVWIKTKSSHKEREKLHF